MKVAVRFLPLSVEVESWEISSEVAIDHSIWVEHRDGKDFVAFNKFFLLENAVDEPFEGVWADSLPRMLSPHDNDFPSIRIILFVLYFQHGNRVIRNAIAYDLSFYQDIAWFRFYVGGEVDHFGESVGIVQCDIGRIIFMLEINCEGECVVIFSHGWNCWYLSCYVAFLIVDVSACWGPSFLLLFSTKNDGLNPLLE